MTELDSPSDSQPESLLDPPLDSRIHAYRPDLADSRLEGRVEAERFTAGEPAVVVAAPCVALRRHPAIDAPRDTEALFGESLRILERSDGWAWVTCDIDDYVGYCPEVDLAAPGAAPTHVVAVPRSHLYLKPDLKTEPVGDLAMQARIAITEIDGKWSKLADGRYIYTAHIAPIERESDPDAGAQPVDIAARFLETPYLWGGRSGFGLDCSALIQLTFQRCGYACPRDTDMQENMPGLRIDPTERLEKGDVVFWPGHVGLMLDDRAILHANATDMSTRIWQLGRLRDHIARIEGHPIRTILRPDYRPLHTPDGEGGNGDPSRGAA